MPFPRKRNCCFRTRIARQNRCCVFFKCEDKSVNTMRLFPLSLLYVTVRRPLGFFCQKTLTPDVPHAKKGSHQTKVPQSRVILLQRKTDSKLTQFLTASFSICLKTLAWFPDWCWMRGSNSQLIITNDPLYHLTNPAISQGLFFRPFLPRAAWISMYLRV